jgi:hypothetical protein
MRSFPALYINSATEKQGPQILKVSLEIAQERRRITIDGEKFWLARAPKRQ